MTRRTIDYICMQPTRQGQASYAHVNEIVAGLRRHGWEVRLVEPPHPRPGRLDGVQRAIVAASTQLSYLASRRFRSAPFVYIRAHFLALPTAIVARMAGSIVVQEINGPSSDAYDSWPLLRAAGGLLSLASRIQVRWADAIVVVTPGLADYVRERTGRRDGFYVIGNGADVERFRPDAGRRLPAMGAGTLHDGSPAAIGAPGDGADVPLPTGRYVVFVGALASWQGVDTILAAVRSPSWPADVDLVIAGDGQEGSQVEAAVHELHNVRWLGAVPYDNVPGLVAGSLAALVPMSDQPRSSYGLSPLKLFEGMASGVPVIASDLPSLGALVRDHECGLTFPAGDSESLASAVAALAADPARAAEMGRRGREAAVTRYSWDARAVQTAELLEQVERERKSRRHGAGD